MSSSKSTIATVLISVQAAFIGLLGLVLIATGRRRHRFARRFFHDTLVHHPRTWALILLLIAAGFVAVAIGIGMRRSWGPVVAYIAEGFAAVASLLNFHPLRSVLGFAIAVAIIMLVASDAPSLQIHDDERIGSGT